jgi:FMN phosphatase YigB (HAD superfamily)
MSRVILIDDSFTNIMGAVNLGCTTVMVDEKHSHLEKILSLSAKLNGGVANVVNHVFKSHA